MSKELKVLVVDDSKFVRDMITSILDESPKIKVVGTAEHPLEARDLIKQLQPDVITLDIEMPHMNGIDFLKRIMRLRPMPVVMISTLTEKGASITIQALEIGAMDFLQKPDSYLKDKLEEFSKSVIKKVIQAHKSFKTQNVHIVESAEPEEIETLSTTLKEEDLSRYIVAIGASTGGVETLKSILTVLPKQMPPILITQHMPPIFTASFANRMNEVCALDVKEAENGDILKPGNVYLAPGGLQLKVAKKGSAKFQCIVDDSGRVNRHKPSVDVLFASVQKEYRSDKIIAALLTGMGDDGARELYQLKKYGAFTIVQDKETSIVWGMPKEAYKLGCTDNVLPLEKIPKKIVEIVEKKIGT